MSRIRACRDAYALNEYIRSFYKATISTLVNSRATAATLSDDLSEFYDLVNRLPSNHHKSRRHDVDSNRLREMIN